MSAEGRVKPSHAPNAPQIPGLRRAKRNPYLAARRPGRELAQRDQVGIGFVVEPFAALDELMVKVAEVSNRPPKHVQPSLRNTANTLRG